MPLPKWDWENPLIPMLEQIMATIEEKDKGDFQGAFVRYNLKYSHLNLIWERLSASTAALDQRHQLFLSHHAESKTGNEEFSDEEKRILTDAEVSLFNYSLDYEDFFIHSKILLDRAIYFTRFLLLDLKDKRKVTTSFTAHRAFFLRQGHFE